MAYEADICPDCGQPLSETTAAEHGRPLHTYSVDLPDVCGGCAAISRDLPEYDDDDRRRAMKFRVVRDT